MEFGAFQLRRKISCKAVEIVYIFRVGRINPRVELNADLRTPSGYCVAQYLDRSWRRYDRIVDEIDGGDLQIFAELLEFANVRDVVEAVPTTLEWSIPVEFLFSIDCEKEALAKIPPEVCERRTFGKISDRPHRTGNVQRLRRSRIRGAGPVKQNRCETMTWNIVFDEIESDALMG